MFNTIKIRKFKSLIRVETLKQVFAFILKVYKNLRGPFLEGVYSTRYNFVSCNIRIIYRSRNLISITNIRSPLFKIVVFAFN